MKDIAFKATDWAQTRTPSRALVLLAEQEAPRVIAEVEDGVRDRGPDAQDDLAVVEVGDNAVYNLGACTTHQSSTHEDVCFPLQVR